MIPLSNTKPWLEPALTALATLQVRLEKTVSPRLSLDPRGRACTALADLLLRSPGVQSDETLCQSVAHGIAGIAEAQLLHFPENIFWDLDFMVADLVRQAAENADPPAFFSRIAALVIDLQRAYGCHSALRFQYVHDFVYGYDWIKWVARDPDKRARFSPFDLRFLRYLQTRAREISRLIEHDDAKYHRIPDDEARNPFGFARRPAQERRLHEELARTGHIPVEAWRADGKCRADFQLYQVRHDVALRLGFGL